jgi:hypothetical protein
MYMRLSTAGLYSARVTVVASIDVAKCRFYITNFVWVNYVAGVNIP